MADECFLSTLLAAGPLYTLPADRQLYNSSTHFSSRTPVILLQVESSIKVILLVAQLLATVPAEDKSCLAQTHALVTSTFDPEQDLYIGAAIDDAVQQLKVCNSPVLPDTEVLQADRPQLLPALPPSKRMILLRCARLLARWATLVLNIKADELTQKAPHLCICGTASWQRLSVSGRHLQHSTLVEVIVEYSQRRNAVCNSVPPSGTHLAAVCSAVNKWYSDFGKPAHIVDGCL